MDLQWVCRLATVVFVRLDGGLDHESAMPHVLRHWKPGGRILTTQLYFPDDPLNRRDGLFDRRLVMRITDTADGRFGRFDFVV